jgi:hypothetical protein
LLLLFSCHPSPQAEDLLLLLLLGSPRLQPWVSQPAPARGYRYAEGWSEARRAKRPYLLPLPLLLLLPLLFICHPSPQAEDLLLLSVPRSSFRGEGSGS